MKLSDVHLDLNEFEPYLSFETGHTQTLLSHLVPTKTPMRNWQEQVIDLIDEDQLLVHYINQQGPCTLSVYHGLTGDSESDYMRRTAEIAIERGWNVILANHRGVKSKARHTKTYHSGRGEDISSVLTWSMQKFQNTRQIAVGFSMSGSILLNLLTGRRGEQKPNFAVVVNAPLDLMKASKKLMSGFSRLYDFRFYQRLRKMAALKQGIKLPQLGNTWDIDENITAVVNGYKDARDYYTQCSAYPYLDRISTKTFVLSSYDDPFIEVEDYKSGKWNKDHVHLTLMKHGGHMGYFSKEKHPKYGHRWMDHYLGSVFDQISKMI